MKELNDHVKNKDYVLAHAVHGQGSFISKTSRASLMTNSSTTSHLDMTYPQSLHLLWRN